VRTKRMVLGCFPGDQKVKEVAGAIYRSAVILSNARGGGEGIDEKVVVVTGGFPHGEPEQVVLNDEFSLGSERLWVVVGNHQLLGLVINEGLHKGWGGVRNQIGVDPQRMKLTV